MLVSIIVPVYNSVHFIEETLDSIRAQYHADFECILIDDMSNDGVDIVIKDYIAKYKDLRFIYLRNSQNLRQGLSRNIGVEVCRGEYFMFMDHDDLLPRDAIQKMITGITDEKLIIGNYATFDTNDIDRNILMVGDINPSTFYNASIKEFSNYYNYVYPWSKLYKREFWLQNNFKFNKVFFEDTAIWSAIAHRARDSILVIPDIVYFFRTGNSLSSGSTIVPEFKKYYAALFERLNILKIYGLLDFDNYFISYCLSDAYSYINDQDFIWQRYRIFLLLRKFIPNLPLDGYLSGIIPDYKLMKIKRMYKFGILYFMIKPKANFIKRKVKVFLK